MPDSQRQLPVILREIAESLFAVVFPSACSLCGLEITDTSALGICRGCWQSLQPWTGPICTGCGLPFVSVHAGDSATSLCGRCRQEEYGFDLGRSYGLYTGNLRAAILQLKFNRRERLGRRLGELLCFPWASVEESCNDEEPLLVPVPLHRSRERERGFNQAALLAQGLRRGLAKRAGGRPLRLEMRCLLRTRATVPQTGLSFQARQENVRGVFDVTLPAKVRDRVVVLVDDVMTTGATLSACAAALKRAGARRVVGLTLARATPQFPDEVSLGTSMPVDESGRQWT